jgi:hypothetical protein
LYSEEEIDLENYKLVNNDGDEIELGGIFSEYYVHVLEKQWLDNSDEKVFLYRGDELIDETDVIYDSRNDERSLSYCGEWRFVESTRGEENNCEEEKEPEEDETEKIINEENIELIAINEIPEPIEGETIKLTGKDIKSEDDIENLRTGNYAVYGFIGFCVLLGFLFLVRKNKYKKNEFRE